jgi:hypothetical protein
MSASVPVCVAVCLPALAVFLVRLSLQFRDLSVDNWQLGLVHLCPRASIESPRASVESPRASIESPHVDIAISARVSVVS